MQGVRQDDNTKRAREVLFSEDNQWPNIQINRKNGSMAEAGMSS
jgi:hypothetical protein